MTREEVVQMMAGGDELETLGHELEEFARSDAEQAGALTKTEARADATMLRVGEDLERMTSDRVERQGVKGKHEPDSRGKRSGVMGSVGVRRLQTETAPFDVVLDEIAETGYAGTELGDWGFFPTEPPALLKLRARPARVDDDRRLRAGATYAIPTHSNPVSSRR